MTITNPEHIDTALTRQKIRRAKNNDVLDLMCIVRRKMSIVHYPLCIIRDEKNKKEGKRQCRYLVQALGVWPRCARNKRVRDFRSGDRTKGEPTRQYPEPLSILNPLVS